MEEDGPLFIVWKPEYSVGNAVLDSQHQKMFHIINELYQQMCSDISETGFQELVGSAVRYAEHHFRSEEDAMRRSIVDNDERLKKQYVQGYYAHTAALDDSIGKIRTALQEAGDPGNTDKIAAYREARRQGNA